MAILWPNLLSLLILFAFIRQRWSRTHSLIEPGIVFATNLILLYPLRSLILKVCTGAAPNYQDLLTGNNLERVSWLATLGCLGFVCGYLLTTKGRSLTILEGTARQLESDDVLVCFLFFLGSLLGITFKIVTGDYISYLLSDRAIPAVSHIASMLTDLQWPTYIGVWVLWFRGVRKPAFLALFASVQCVVVPFQFIQGSKTFLSLLIVSIVLAYYWVRAKLPKTTALAGLAFIALFVFPYVQSFREFINEKYGRIPNLSALDFRGFGSSYLDDTSSSAEDKLLAVSARYGGVDELYNVTQVIPRLLPYRYCNEYSAFFINLVPRAVWPDKPVYSRGAVYGAALNTITSVTPFPFGEAYWDFGVPGLLVSMMIWGFGLGGVVLLYERFYKKRGMSLFIGLYFLSQIYWITGSESYMPSAISSIPQQAALLWAVYMVLRALRPLPRIQTRKLRTAA
jgi:hypothetical protein